METAAVLELSEPIAAPAIAAPPEQAPIMMLSSYGGKIKREQLPRVPTPCSTATHKPIPHIQVVEKLIEALSFRQIGVVLEEYAVSADGMNMFGVMDLTSGFQGCRFAIGLRNSHDKSFRLSCTVGLQSLRLRESGISRGVHAGLGKALQEFPAGGQPRCWSGPHAAKLWPLEGAG